LVSSNKTGQTLVKARHLRSIKSKIIVFALLATFIPSLTMGWLSYVKNRRILSEKITQELHSLTSHTARELELWLKERLYEERVFASSYVVSENLEKILRDDTAPIQKTLALHRLKDYLKSVSEKFIAYEELLVVDLSGNVVASSFEKEAGVTLPTDWLKNAKEGRLIVGEPAYDSILKTGSLVIAGPIFTGHERFLGVLVAKLNFRTIGTILKSYGFEGPGELYLINREGLVLIGSKPMTGRFMEAGLEKSITTYLFSNEGKTTDYKNHRGHAVVGVIKKIPKLDWGVIAEKNRNEAYAEIFRLRNMTIAFTMGLLFVIGLIAYLLGLSIVRPLNRLIGGARKVAAGDLDVDLPVAGQGELGYMTEVFNDMVSRLREGREELAAINETLREKNNELREISITDTLTALHNRKHMMESLVIELARSKRKDHPLAIFMIDIDHFKRYNDTLGHLAGDEILRKLGALFKASIRSCDCASRYGGEEFLIMLPETDSTVAAITAERIRSQVSGKAFGDKNKKLSVTISMGVAVFPRDGDEPEALIACADKALYEAKENGRNRVVIADTPAGAKVDKRKKKK
jgi:diguanylate cyclase (GGDEF)-like protein